MDEKNNKKDSFCIKLPENMSKEQWNAFNNAMNKVHDAMMKDVDKLSKELGISECCAESIYYLRTRSRWSQEKEQILIDLDKQGKKLPCVYSGEI